MLHACALLSKQSSFPIELKAIHIHHGLSPNADQWLSFCQNLCEQMHVPFQFQKVNVPAQARQSLEETARNARYKAIDELASVNTLVLLGQHEDDQAETLLLQLKRGAGPKGLSGMAERFKYKTSVEYARPWINAGIGKQEILDYAKENQLSWVEDESNEDSAFDRNFLRNELMPILKAKWPKINKTICRSAKLCAAQNEIVESFALESLENIQNENASLSLAGLANLPNALANEVIRLWSTQQIGFAPSAAQLDEIHKLSAAKADQIGYVHVNNWQCRSFEQALYWVAISDVLDTPVAKHALTIDIKGEAFSINVNYGDLQRKVSLYANRPRKSIKAWMKESSVAPWKRLGMPILCHDEQIIAVQMNDKLVISELFIEEYSLDHASCHALRQLIQEL
jgi:tRNA(Ile)-lysidine synthase